MAPTTAEAAAGLWSGKFYLPADSANRQACEFLHTRYVDPNTHDWFAVAFKLPTNWQGVTEHNEISQFNYEGINGSPLSLQLYTDSAYIAVHSGACSPSGTLPGCPYWSGSPLGLGYASRGMPNPGPYFAVPRGQLTLGVWHEVIIHVYWTTQLNGVIEAWHRVKGQPTWTHRFSQSGGFPTLQTGTRYDGYVITASNIGSVQNVDKFGLYRKPASFSETVWLDGWCRATSFSAAASCVP